MPTGNKLGTTADSRAHLDNRRPLEGTESRRYVGGGEIVANKIMPRGNLRAEMARYGIKPADIAQAAGVSLSAAKEWVRGATSPRVEQAIAVSRNLFDGLPVEYLWVED